MKQNIDWKSIAETLDVTNVYAPKHYIRTWTTFDRTETWIIFHCDMANGEELDYHVDVIDVDIFRMRMNPRGIIECGSDMLVSCEFPPVPFSVQQLDDRLMITTARIRLEFPHNWQVTAYDHPEAGKGHIFYQESTEDRAYGPGFEVPPTGFEVSESGDYFVRQSVSIQPGESFYGLGEKFTSLDKWKHEIPLWAVDSGNVSTLRSYKNVPLLLSSSGYAVFIHSSFPMLFRLGSESSVSYSIHLRDSQLDMFLIYGPSYKHILKRYSELTGFAPVPPKWSFGFWISRAGYRSRPEVEEVVTEMRRRGFPCDVLSLDPWWMGEGPWCHYEWDEKQFPQPDEMMAWIQVGVFSSHVRAHGKQAREPWTFGEEVGQISLKYLKLRYRLLPYIYSQAVQSTRTAIPMACPMVLEFQDDPTTQHVDLQYMFGDRFLVAPVLTRDGRTKVYLPAGTWVDYWSKEVLSGPQWLTIDVPLESLPLWVKAGSIIPMGPEMDYVNQKPLDPLTIEIYLPAVSEKILVEDEDCEPVEVSYSRNGSQLLVEIGATSGNVEIVLIGERIQSARMTHNALDVTQIAFGSCVQMDGRLGTSLVLDLELR